MQADLKRGLRANRARISEENRYGTVHVQVNMLLGVNKTEMAVTGWIIRKGSGIIELSTVRPYRGKRDDF